MVYSHSGTLYSNEDEQCNAPHKKMPHNQDAGDGKPGTRVFILWFQLYILKIGSIISTC